MNNLIGLFFAIYILVSPNMISQINSKVLGDKEKEFIALKMTKVQADYDDIKTIHDDFQNDSIEYNERGVILNYIGSAGNFCFDEETFYDAPIDIHAEIISEENQYKADIDLFRTYRYIDGKQYFIAIDSNAYIFLLHNFWKDEFKRFINKNYGLIDDISKAINTVNLYLNTKLYNPRSKKQIIIDSLNINQYKNELSYLEPLKWFKSSDDKYYLSFYTISPCDKTIIYYNFNLTKSCDIIHTSKIIKYIVRD